MKTKLFILCILIFRVASAQYTKLLDFAGSSNGRYPQGSLITDGSFLYGMTTYGGSNDSGTVFKIKHDGTGYVKLHDFAGSSNGRFPYGTLISDGTFLYGTTAGGGTTFGGTVFKIKPDGTGYTNLYSFTYNPDGSGPTGSLFYDGTFLYGTTTYGGTYYNGTIFKIKPDGSGYVKLLDFTYSNGTSPSCSFISDGTFLYGTTFSGGTNNGGVIFKIKPDGTGYTKLLDFNSSTGKFPQGTLVSDGTFLYGMTQNGGASDLGTVFKIKRDGTGYTTLLDFSGSINGRNPSVSLVFEGTFLYGTTAYGGINDRGTIFKIKPDGSGYTKLLDFAGNPDGRSALGSLVSDGTFFYGMTVNGGVTDEGTVYKIKPEGITGITNNIEGSSFTIYPNPSSGHFQLNMSFPLMEKAILEIFNTKGEKLYSAIIAKQQNEIDISNLSNGMYFIRIKDGVKIYNSKLVVQ